MFDYQRVNHQVWASPNDSDLVPITEAELADSGEVVWGAAQQFREKRDGSNEAKGKNNILRCMACDFLCGIVVHDG